jgi:hypothetical protein
MGVNRRAMRLGDAEDATITACFFFAGFRMRGAAFPQGQ